MARLVDYILDNWFWIKEIGSDSDSEYDSDSDSGCTYKPKYSVTWLLLNPNLSIDDIKKISDKTKVPLNLSTSLHITLNDVVRDISYKWDMYELSKNPNITIDDIKNTSVFNWNYIGILQNPNLDYKFYKDVVYDKLKKHHYKDCNTKGYYSCFCFRSSIQKIPENNNLCPEKIIESYKNIKKFQLKSIEIRQIANNPKLTLDLIDKNINLFRDKMFFLSLNPNITIAFLRKHIDKFWQWDRLVLNPNIKIQEIIDNPDLGWGPNANWWDNPNVLMSDLMKHNITDSQKWKVVSRSPYTTLKQIKKNMDYPWCWDNVSLNPNIHMKFVIHNFYISWNYKNIASNLMTYHPIVYSRNITQIIKQNSFIIRELSDIMIKFV